MFVFTFLKFRGGRGYIATDCMFHAQLALQGLVAVAFSKQAWFTCGRLFQIFNYFDVL
jgi:hypothetical protein